MTKFDILTGYNWWQQYKQRNFYTLSKNGTKVLCSYSTVVGLVVGDVAYTTTTKYSPTTSKQLTQYCREQNLRRISLENCFLDSLLKKFNLVA